MLEVKNEKIAYVFFFYEYGKFWSILGGQPLFIEPVLYKDTNVISIVWTIFLRIRLLIHWIQKKKKN